MARYFRVDHAAGPAADAGMLRDETGAMTYPSALQPGDIVIELDNSVTVVEATDGDS